jgi:hypothetical protein
MKTAVVIALLLIALFFYPQVNEGSGSPCAATEKRFARSVMDTKDGGSIFGLILISGISNGALAAEAAKNQYPNIPASLGCVILYYRIMANPDFAKKVASDR